MVDVQDGQPPKTVKKVRVEVRPKDQWMCSAVTKAVKAVDRRARVRVDMATLTVEIEESSSTGRQLSDTIKRAEYSPIAA